MSIMTSREFNQNTGLAQKRAMTSPVIITNRGKPAFVLINYDEYQQQHLTERTIGDALADIYDDGADVELELQPRRREQRHSVDFGEI